MKLSATSVRRRGAILILALVLMAVLAVILSTTAVQIVTQRRLAHQRQRQLQAEWLARTGTELAVARLLEKPAAFTDEQTDWVPESTLRIEVEKADSEIYRIRVEATVGKKNEAPVARTAATAYRRTEAKGAVRLEPVPPSRQAP
jgi:hypothetical protein